MKRYRKLPYGYRMAGGEIQIFPQERDIVVGIFDQYLAGVGPVKIAARLNERGVCYQADNPIWNKCQLYRILSDERYAGTDSYPPIISADRLVAVQNTLESNKSYCAPDDVLARSVADKLTCSCGVELKRDRLKLWQCPECGKEVLSGDIESNVRMQMLRLRDNPKLAEHGKRESYSPTGEIMRTTSEIRRALNSRDVNERECRQKILRCAALKYEAYQPDHTEYIKRVVEAVPPEQWAEDAGITEVIRKTVSEIIIDAPGALRIRLKNGAALTTAKEDINGNSSG